MPFGSDICLAASDICLTASDIANAVIFALRQVVDLFNSIWLRITYKGIAAPTARNDANNKDKPDLGRSGLIVNS